MLLSVLKKNTLEIDLHIANSDVNQVCQVFKPMDSLSKTKDSDLHRKSKKQNKQNSNNNKMLRYLIKAFFLICLNSMKAALDFLSTFIRVFVP